MRTKKGKIMLSASAMSAKIRAKKKAMEDESGAVKLSGIPEDATDIEILKQHEATDELNENHPKETFPENNDPVLEKAPDLELENEKAKKQMKIKAIFSRMK